MRLVAFLFALLFIVSCSPTRITVANYKDAVIYSNGNYIGTGTAEIPRLGTRKPALITAQYKGKEVGSVKIVREFDGGSFVAGMFSYGVGFFICKKYPLNVTVPTQAPSNTLSEKNKRSWDQSPGLLTDNPEKKSSWDLPPKIIENKEKTELPVSNNKWDQKPELKNESTTETGKFSDLFGENENQISFDSQGKIYILTKELEDKIQLFSKIEDFKSAKIYKSGQDSMFLQIETLSKNIKLNITEANLQKMRDRVDTHLKY